MIHQGLGHPPVRTVQMAGFKPPKRLINWILILGMASDQYIYMYKYKYHLYDSIIFYNYIVYSVFETTNQIGFPLTKKSLGPHRRQLGL